MITGEYHISVDDKGRIIMPAKVRTEFADGTVFLTQGVDRCLWIFGPEETYELVGDVGGVVFLTGYTLQDDGDTLHLYYGGADKCVALATASLKELLVWIKKNGQPDAAIDVWF